MTAGRRIGVTILRYRRRNEMKAGRCWARLAALIGAGSIALMIAGCAPSEDQSQAAENADLRAMVASDQQQINAMQEKIGDLNDQLTELQHNGGSGDDQAALQQRIAKLEAQVNASKPDASTSPVPLGGTPNGAPNPTANGFPAGVTPPAPDANAPMAANGPPPPPGPPPVVTNTEPGANASPAANSDDDNDSDDKDDSDNQTASTTPPSAPAPINAIGPWQAQIDPQLQAAASSGDPAAKPYSAGLIALKGGMYPQALGKFEELQHKYPKSDLSESAEYFSANALFEMGKYEQAILQFNDVTMRFPSGKFASASMLREAQAFQKINDQIDARLTLQKLVNDHPDSPEAAAAKSMMQGMANG
jgi:tol-pal system protein YbgF